jgi:metalloendopeptidase OMA1, mitochondrial
METTMLSSIYSYLFKPGPGRRRVRTLAAIAVLIVVVVSACYTNPLTHRNEFIAMSSQEEITLGTATFDTLKRETPISTNPQQVEAVRRVGQRIAAQANLPGAQWEFVCFKDDNTVNAFCLPGGKIGVYTGILPLTQDDNGLAVVLGHEVCHAVARHGGERMTQILALNLGGMLLSAALQQQPARTVQYAMAAYGVGGTLLAELPFSRKQESEADYMGLLTMAKAGYDPQQAVTFWQRFQSYAASHGGEPPEFLSTHPVNSTRIKDIQTKLPEAQKIYNSRH